MRCYFIRHGQSTNNHLADLQGNSKGRVEDPELTPLGLEQARRAAVFLRDGFDSGDGNKTTKGFGITHLYCSLHVRAIQTANEISKELSLSLNAWEAIHEEGGIFHEDEETGERIGQIGKSRDQLLQLFPNLILPNNINPSGWWNHRLESRADARLRARRVLNDLLSKHGESDDRVVLVSHAAFYNCFVRAVLELDPEKDCWFGINNTAISRFDFSKDGIYLAYQNESRFLGKEQIS